MAKNCEEGVGGVNCINNPMSLPELQTESHPRVGVGVMILKEGKVLLSCRKTSHGGGSYAFPGGHLEHLESFEECALREIAEECGIQVTNLRFLYLANLKMFAPKQYVHIHMIADWRSGEPQVLEPERNEVWDWYSLDALPQPRFPTCDLAFEAYKTGRNYWDNVVSV